MKRFFHGSDSQPAFKMYRNKNSKQCFSCLLAAEVGTEYVLLIVKKEDFRGGRFDDDEKSQLVDCTSDCVCDLQRKLTFATYRK